MGNQDIIFESDIRIEINEIHYEQKSEFRNPYRADFGF